MLRELKSVYRMEASNACSYVVSTHTFSEVTETTDSHPRDYGQPYFRNLEHALARRDSRAGR